MSASGGHDWYGSLRRHLADQHQTLAFQASTIHPSGAETVRRWLADAHVALCDGNLPFVVHMLNLSKKRIKMERAWEKRSPAT